MATMLLGGLWHGAGWRFVVWGGLHGLYLVVNHGWWAIAKWAGLKRPERSTWLGRRLGQLVTFLAVVVGWVFFRATTFEGALGMLDGMVGFNGVSLPVAIAYRIGPLAQVLIDFGISMAPGGGATFAATWLWIGALMAVAMLFPNTQELMRRYRPAFDFRMDGRTPQLVWRPTAAWAMTTAVIFAGGILALPQVSEFLYFQF